ncbi:MAG: transketolase [Pseudomonadota bacterium]|nr:transketolase [Pseudomonadota bacterium]
MRDAFADEITKLAAQDERVVLLSGDIGNRMFDKFKAGAPDRFYNCGVAEANMMSVAAGLGLCGLRPVVYTITPFTTTRCFEQIRVDACYHRSPVIIVGTGSGLSYATLGPTHHSLEDIAILRTLPGMTVFCPCDAMEVRAGLRAALKQDNPVYIRLGKKGEPVIHPDIPNITLGKSYTIRQGSDLCLLSTGNTMPLALEAADALAAQGVSVRVESVHTVKPLDTVMLAEVFSRYKVVAVIEEHGVIGGLYGAVAEWRGTQSFPARLAHFGTEDRFYHRVGSQAQLRESSGLTRDGIVEGLLKAAA